MALNIRIQWNAGTACVSECVLKTLACRGLRVGPSKGGVLQYKWEECWGMAFIQGLEARKAQQYKWGAYCSTNWRCTPVLLTIWAQIYTCSFVVGELILIILSARTLCSSASVLLSSF